MIITEHLIPQVMGVCPPYRHVTHVCHARAFMSWWGMYCDVIGMTSSHVTVIYVYMCIYNNSTRAALKHHDMTFHFPSVSLRIIYSAVNILVMLVGC